MTTRKPTFRVMKKGYDRFAVDDAVERYTEQIDALERKVTLYQQQLIEVSKELKDTQARLVDMEKSEVARREAAENIARLSIREANTIVETAKQNADEIIREALGTARLVLIDLTKLYQNAGTVKSRMSSQLYDLLKELDDFKLPDMPDIRWLKEAEKKLR